MRANMQRLGSHRPRTAFAMSFVAQALSFVVRAAA
jgi:hypothetical protein